MLFHIRAMNLPLPIPEFKFHPTRKWRFDFAYPDSKIAIECEGGIYTMGRHIRPRGFMEDIEKYNSATMMGWRVLRFDPAKIKSGKAVDDIKLMLLRFQNESEAPAQACGKSF